jgi:hypothetical protein
MASSLAAARLATPCRVRRARAGHARYRRATRAAGRSSDDETGEAVEEVRVFGSEGERSSRVRLGIFSTGEIVTSTSGSGASFVIRGLLGRGSFGTTYEAETEDGTIVALKCLALREQSTWKALELFEREAKVLKNLSHPSIPDYVDYFEIDTAEDRKFCLVQRVAPGTTLESLVDGGWRPSETEVEDVARQLLEVLSYLGSLRPPVVHRDVKPSNVLLDRATGEVSLVDFGATADAVVSEALASGMGKGMGSTMVGTFGYCAPEQMIGGVTPVSDLYSAGATILFLLAGRSPASLPQSRLKVNFRGAVQIENPRLERVVATLMEPSPEDRFQTAADAIEALVSTRGGIMGGRNFRGARLASDDDDGDFATADGVPGSTWDDFDAAPAPGPRAPAGTSSRGRGLDATRPRRRTKKPANSRVIVEREGKTKLLIVIPPAGLTANAAATGGFAILWNSIVATWTVSALAGGGILFAAFSIPFWLAGGGVAKMAYEEVFEASRLTLDAAPGTYALDVTATGLKNDVDAGDLDDVTGARIVVESTTNDVPNYCLELEIGAKEVRFGRGLKLVELEHLCAEVNAFLDVVQIGGGG